MNEYSQPGAGKIEVHGNGVGTPSREDVERRAREIALIDERDPDEFTDADWNQARHELLGDVMTGPPEENADTLKLRREWEVIPEDTGHRVPRPGIEEDEESVGEHCVSEGVEEAARDQMLEARRRRDRAGG